MKPRREENTVNRYETFALDPVSSRSPEESVVVGGPAEPSVFLAVPPTPTRLSGERQTWCICFFSTSACTLFWSGVRTALAQHAIVVHPHNLAGQQQHYGAIVAPSSRRRKRECKV